MPKSQNGPRSNFSLLPFDVQYKIIGLLQDGATFATISSDADIAQAYRSRGLKLAPPAISRLKQSDQYRQWTAARLRERSSFTADRLTTAFLKENASADTIAEQSKVALLKVVSDLSDLSDMSDDVEKIKALRTLAGTLGALDSATLKNSIAKLQRKLDDRNRQFAAAETEWKAREAELLAKVAELENKLQKYAGTGNDSVIDEMDKFVKGK